MARSLRLSVALLALAALGYGSPLASAGVPPGGSPNEPRPPVAFESGRISLRVQKRPLSWLLNEISRAVHVAIVSAEELGEERISAEFDNLPVDEALRQVLKHHDAFFFYGMEGKEPAALRVVWVYPQGSGRGLEPVPPEKWASTKEMEQRLEDSDPELRIRSIEALIERKGNRALPAVRKALADQDDQVRTIALNSALDAGVELPEDLLVKLVLSDGSRDVRFLALQALGTNPEMRWIAERSLSDPDQHVQRKARNILDGLEAAGRPAAAPPPAQGPPPQRP